MTRSISAPGLPGTRPLRPATALPPALLIFGAAFVLGFLGVTAAPASEGPAFSASATDLMKLSATVPLDPEQGVQVLAEEALFRLDEEGRVDYRFRVVFRIDSAGAVQPWSQVSQGWQPWHQKRPEIQARVITTDGAVHQLDPATLGEYSEGDEGPNIYGDNMRVRGPLPAVDVGAIVETLYRVEDTAPFFAAGTIRSFVFGRGVPVHRTEMILEAPAALPLSYQAHRLPDVTPERTEARGRVTLRFETGLLEPWTDDASLAPGDVARRPLVSFSTGASWNAVAEAYEDLVEEQMGRSDVRKIARKVLGKERDPDVVLQRLLAHVHEEVRYTGIEFGAQSLVPTSPQETLKRKFGDCKDKATLLVALLREAGIEAHVALLRTGPGMDVDPGLPGLGRFNHAIVQVPGSPERWIDATAPYARVGQLPGGDQGRLALVASSGTEELQRLPVAKPADNLRRELREVRFAPEGGGRVLETTEVFGAYEREYRLLFDGSTEPELREQFERYVKNQYRAEALGEMEMSAVDDLEEPVVLKLEALEAGRVQTSEDKASVYVNVGSLVRDLPVTLKPAGDDEDREPRAHPVLLERPYVVEIRYRIQPPPGYALESKPEDREQQFGPAVMSEHYEVSEDGVVTAEIRFDTAQSLYSVEEANQTRQDLASFYEGTLPQVVFYQVGEDHLEAGRIQEALTEFGALVRLHPEEALYRTQVARAYLAAGLGGTARREATRAVELAPDSMIAHRTLGVILAHDRLGRKFTQGFDLAGAEAALRRAKELAPEDFVARGELAILLEHGPEGERYGSDARLTEAVVEYQEIRTDLENDGLSTNLLICQLYLRGFDDALEIWKEAPRNAGRDGVYIAAFAALRGAEEAIAEASRITDQAEAFRSALVAASDWLRRIRRYPEAASLLAAGARGDTGRVAQLGVADALRNVRPYSPDPVRTTAEGTVHAFLIALVARDPTAGELESLFVPELLESADAEHMNEIFEAMAEAVPHALYQEGANADMALDWLLSLGKLSLDGDEKTGVRARLRIPAATGSTPMLWTFYLVKVGAEYRLAGFSYTYPMIGRMLLGWLDDGETDRVRQWLNWLTEDGQELFGTEDPLEAPPLLLIWTRSAEGTEEMMRAAAASLMVDGAYGSEPFDLLQELTAGLAEGDPATGVNLALAAGAGATERPELQLEAGRRLQQADPRSRIPFQIVFNALALLERWDEAEAEALARKDRWGSDPFTSSVYADLPRMREDLPEHRRRLESLVDSGRASFGDYNNLAWLDIVEDRVSEKTLQAVQQAVSLSDYSEISSLHTLATVYAEMGLVGEARDVLLALIQNRTSNDLESPDWYVLGRIAEQYGAVEEALEAYRKVEPPENEQPETGSTHALATRRIAILTAAERGKGAALTPPSGEVPAAPARTAPAG